MKLQSTDDQLMAMAAHRYCLGRQSYIVSSCIAWLRTHWDQIDSNMRNVILRDTIEALIEERAGDKSIDAPIEQAVALYLRESAAQQADGNKVGRNLAQMLPWYRGRRLDELGDVARRYAAEHKHLQPATLRQRLQNLRSAAVWALKHHGLGSRDWIERIAMPRVANARHLYLRRVEVLRLARACADRGTRALILLTFYTGSRPGELHRAAPAGDALLMPRTKNGERRLLPVLPNVRYLLRHWPLPFDYTYYSRRFRAARDAIGRPDLHLHDLRHSTASELANRGFTLWQVGQVLGHKTAQATTRYAHLYGDEARAALAAIRRPIPHRRAT